MTNSPSESDRRAIAAKWDDEARLNQQANRDLRTRWWMHPYVVRQINKRLCGQPIAGWAAGLHQRARAAVGDQLPFGRGVSVGCGTGGKEMDLIEAGVVHEFVLYELSSARIGIGRDLAAKRGLADRVEFRQEDAFAADTEPGAFDLVHWDNSLHHMFDVASALDWSADVLRPSGLFYMYDFVGPSRFQWTPAMLELATAVRSGLPETYLEDPNRPGTYVAKSFAAPPTIESMIAKDPSEAADSGRIMTELHRVFPDADVVPTGGVVYSLALNDIIHNFRWDPLDPLLIMLMLLDFQAADAGLTHYAAALAQKPSRRHRPGYAPTGSTPPTRANEATATGTDPEESVKQQTQVDAAVVGQTSAVGWCPACANDVEAWLPGPGGRPNASCGHCWSLERHRFLASLLHGMRPYVETMGAVLEFAPQRQIQSLLRRLAPSATYVGTDLFDLRFATVAADGCALPFDDASFDMILSFHVLEHIPDDAQAMREIRRVLKPGGLAIVQVPRRTGVATEEDFNASPEDKARRFGQSDHVRYYGDDLEARFEAAGLRTTYFEANSLLDADQLRRFNVPAKNPLWICRRSTDR